MRYGKKTILSGWRRQNLGVRDSREKGAGMRDGDGTGRDGTGPPFPDPERFYVSLPIHLTINRLMTAT